MDTHHTPILTSIAFAVAGGMLLNILARRIKVPSIILLLFGGFAMGGEGLGIVHPESLEGFLPVLVSLAVGIILFEGGLTLDLKGYMTAPGVIRRLLSIGVVVSWMSTSFFSWLLLGTSPMFSLLMGSLVIVTGPTVIVPLLQRIRIVPRLHNILHWEAVLIDPIGVFIAILCFDWVAGGDTRSWALAEFGLRVISGLVIGFTCGYGVYLSIHKKIVPDDFLNAFALGSAVFTFGLAEVLLSEAGLLAVTTAGLVVGWKHPIELKQIRQFKAEISDLLIGMLFILLAARLSFEQFSQYGTSGFLLVAAVLFVVRPLVVLTCSWRSDLGFRDKLFLSWVAPRGIVAASMASLFALALAGRHPEEGEAALLEPFTYSVIIATVVLQGLTAPILARILGVQQKKPTGWLIVGGHPFARQIAHALSKQGGLHVIVMDTNPRFTSEARSEGLTSINENALEVSFAEDRLEFQNVGNVLALTDNAELNDLICQHWAEFTGKKHVFRWSPPLKSTSGKTARHRLVLSSLPRPSVVSGELGNGEAKLDPRTVDQSTKVTDSHFLFAIRGEALLFPEDAGNVQFAAEAGDQLFFLRRSGGLLRNALEAGDILMLQANSTSHLFAQLVNAAVKCCPKLPADATIQELIEQQKHFPNNLGHGIVVPHIHTTATHRRVCILALIQEKDIIKPDAADSASTPEEEDPVRLVFFLLSPAGDPERHLAALAEIARFCSNPKNREAMLKSRDEDALRLTVRNLLAAG